MEPFNTHTGMVAPLDRVNGYRPNGASNSKSADAAGLANTIFMTGATCRAKPNRIRPQFSPP
jgi:hypothetical protein